jgi:hypothetical protein
MTVANSYLGYMLGGRQKHWPSVRLVFWSLLIAAMGWSLSFTKYTYMGLSGFSFTALSDVMRASETATNIDDKATSCIGMQPW